MKKKILLSIITILLLISVLALIFYHSSTFRYPSSNDTVETSAVNTTIPSQSDNRSSETSNDNASQISNTENSSSAYTNEATNHYIDTMPTSNPTYSADEIEESKWKSFEVTLNNTKLQFPFSVSTLYDLGYQFDDTLKEKSLDYGAVDNPNIYKNGKAKDGYLNLYITNNTELSLVYDQCQVIGINIVFANTDKDLSVSIENLSIDNDTKKQDLISYLGLPTQTHEESDIETLTYSDSNASRYWNFGFKNDHLFGFDIYVS